ncbi:MAG: PLP-dependent aminotransferase family protein [Spirochaetes bacterium]|nr:PLP-dependent aminotransferase family protein [Spirochaetota bacterium]
MEKKKPLYITIADDIAMQIDKGIYRVGDKLPSIRQMSQISKVSINTIKEAYFRLENKQLISPRPQSGYFVKFNHSHKYSYNKKYENDTNIKEAITTDLFHEVHRDYYNKEFVQLGCTHLYPDLLPIKKLNNILSSQLKLHSEECVSSTDYQGVERLRVQIAKRYAQIGCFIEPDDIYITSGCIEALMFALMSICKQGDTIAVEHPVFPGSLHIWEKLGLNIIEVPSSLDTGICLDTLEFVLQNNDIKACYVIPNFNNPLGSLMPENKKKRLVDLVEKYDIPIIEDDVFGDLYFNQERPGLLQCFSKEKNVISISSFSKTLAPGYRVGWIVPGKYKKEYDRFKICMPSTNMASQFAISEFLENGGFDRYLRGLRHKFINNLELMINAINKYFPSETRFNYPEGGCSIWLDLPEWFDSVKLYLAAKTYKITFIPGPVFTTTTKFRNSFRLSVTKWSEDVENAIKILGNLIYKQKKL